jgi:hypothetical protein
MRIVGVAQSHRHSIYAYGKARPPPADGERRSYEKLKVSFGELSKGLEIACAHVPLRYLSQDHLQHALKAIVGRFFKQFGGTAEVAVALRSTSYPDQSSSST